MSAKSVTLIPVAPFLLEMQSERMIDAMVALQQAGFTVTYIMGSMNRYRIDDEVPLTEATRFNP